MFLKESSGAFHLTCLPIMESSEASMREACLSQSRDGSTLVHVQGSGKDKVIIAYIDKVVESKGQL